MFQEYSSYSMNENIRIVVDDNPDDINSEKFHCHVVKYKRKRVATLLLKPYCRFKFKPDKNDLNHREQAEVINYCESIKDRPIKDCENLLLRKNK